MTLAPGVDSGVVLLAAADAPGHDTHLLHPLVAHLVTGANKTC
jgi:hypothetical protein